MPALGFPGKCVKTLCGGNFLVMSRRRAYYKFLLWLKGLQCFFKTSTRTTSMRKIKVRENNSCPYCIIDEKFLPMRRVAEGRLICGHCGHIVVRDDRKFRCPCAKCVEIDYSPRFRRFKKELNYRDLP